ncbi:MAG: type II toxin-antitoxin system PrlF family antitoxin [Deltaproteobacteria bacterium]|nr:type II toxin-antitoxin system PrlF family antitoxin [Deltaproteobacteria bacterium]
MVIASKISRKWQVVIPKQVRDNLSLRPGDRISFEITRSGATIRKQDESPFDRYCGFLEKRDSTDRIIREQWGDR